MPALVTPDFASEPISKESQWSFSVRAILEGVEFTQVDDFERVLLN